jgi:hypothetical protein
MATLRAVRPAASSSACASVPPYEVELELHGDDWGDVAYFGSDVLVSPRFADAWKRAQLVGLEILARVRDVKPRRDDLPEYLRTVVARSEAAVDEARSRIVRNRAPTCPGVPLGRLRCDPRARAGGGDVVW